MDLLFAYLAGLLTLINPCVLPVVPIVLATAASGSRLGSPALAAGMSFAFTAFGLATSSVGPAIGLTAESVSWVGAMMMILFGLVLVTPQLNAAVASAAAGLANSADWRLRKVASDNPGGAFLGGILLGAVWSPCIGPTLGAAIALASQGASLAWAGAIMLTFSLGVSTVMLALSYGTREAIRARQERLRSLAPHARPIMGVAFIAVGIAILFGLQHAAERALLGVMPAWLQDLSVSL